MERFPYQRGYTAIVLPERRSSQRFGCIGAQAGAVLPSASLTVGIAWQRG